MSDRSSVLVSVSKVLEMDESVLEDHREGPIAVSFLKSNGYCPSNTPGCRRCRCRGILSSDL